MEVVVLIILLMAGFAFLAKLTYHGTVGRVALCAIAALFVAFATDSAASQSKTQIDSWLESPEFMLDAAVLLTIDVASQIAFCFLMGRKISGGLKSVKGRLVLAVLLWFPGLAIFPALLAFLTELIFSFTGADFSLVGYTLAVAVLIGAPLAAAAFRWLLPEDDIRLELLFLASLLTAALGVTATVNGRTAAAGVSFIEWNALGAVVLLLICGATAGIIFNKYMINKRIGKI
ncbi:MAG: hypothetical protein NC210_04805 [[Clostridium] fimetarium]|nr:hypothetical protein [Alistipes timonensis]MCM1405725.1 hypothetical protein [[Clostridium] fimetarium]